jgi:hypothetical protein
MLDCLAGFFHYVEIVSHVGKNKRDRERTQLGRTSIQGLTPFFTARSSIARASFLLPLKQGALDEKRYKYRWNDANVQ